MHHLVALGQKPEIRILAGIEYRGQRPETIEEWRLLHLAIKTATSRRR